jgi:hypothetical protein
MNRSSATPSPPPAPVPAPAAVQNAYAAWATAQLADQPRLPWSWGPGKVTTEYAPVVRGKWWSPGNLPASTSVRNTSHIGRIMETELGERLPAGRRCSACADGGEECWVYSVMGARQVRHPGDTCARCRVAARSGGCSISTRKQVPRKGSPAPPPLRSLLPKGPPPPPPGASGVMV